MRQTGVYNSKRVFKFYQILAKAGKQGEKQSLRMPFKYILVNLVNIKDSYSFVLCFFSLTILEITLYQFIEIFLILFLHLDCTSLCRYTTVYGYLDCFQYFNSVNYWYPPVLLPLKQHLRQKKKKNWLYQPKHTKLNQHSHCPWHSLSLSQGSPTPRPWTGTSPYSVRNRATQWQAGKQAKLHLYLELLLIAHLPHELRLLSD